MPPSDQPSRPLFDPRLVALVGGLLVARLIYIAWWCPYSLVEDEAQYWEWGKHLSLSYYTKGPGIAWLIAATTSLLGDTEFGVRAAAPVFSAIMTLAMAGLVRTLTGDPRKGLYAGVALQLAPIFQATAFLSTIDGPYCACWAVAAWLAWRAVHTESRLNWLGLGAVLGIGFLFKYTILLLVPGLFLFPWLCPARAASRRSPLGPALAAGAFLLFASPVIIWNQTHGWPTLAHLLGHLGFTETASATVVPNPHAVSGPHWSPLWLPEFLGSQLGLAGPLAILALLGVVSAWRDRTSPDAPGRLFLAVCGLPILLFYILVSFVAEPEGNWPVGGYVTLLPLAGILAADEITSWRQRVAAWRALPAPRPRQGLLRRQPESLRQVLWHVGIWFGLISGILMPRVDLLAHAPLLGKYIPVGRLRQGKELAESVEGLLAGLRTRLGSEPAIISAHYGRASQLAFYLPGHPRIYCASSKLGGRPTQQDYWPSHQFTAYPPPPAVAALCIGGYPDDWPRLFPVVEPLGPLKGQERKRIDAFLGFAGPTPPKPASPNPGTAAPVGE